MSDSAPAAEKLGNIGIVMMSAAGDAVHTLPIVNALKRHSPSSRITWVLQPAPATLVRGHPHVDSIIEFDRSRGLRAYADVRAALEQTPLDLLIDLQVYFKAGLVTALANAPIKLGFDHARARDANWLFTNRKIPAHPVQHVQDQYFEFLDYLHVPHDVPVWNLGPWANEREWQTQWCTQFDRPLAALVIATSKPQKDWLPERWAAVCDALYADFGVQPVLVGGRSPRELEAEQIIMQRASHRPHSALGSGMRKLVSILDASSLVIAPDTGPLHMAVALDRPAISLLGYTNPKRTGPYRRFHDLMIDAYADPGEDYVASMENRPGRMERIAVDDVLNRIEVWSTAYRS
ncbi:MAG: glycosyltransferase family 9 protein [Gemmatimonadaceae bacterium]